MDPFCIRYAIFLLLVITQKFTFADVRNETHQRTVPAKLITNLFKVSWLDLNSDWRNKVSPHCRNDIETLFDSADSGEKWALQMLDASSKVPAGVLEGNILDFGMFGECIRVKSHQNPANIQGRHCMVAFSIPSKFVEDPSEILYMQKLSLYNPSAGVDLSLTLSVCLPSSCGVEDVFGFVNASVHNTPEFTAYDVNVARVTCSGVESTDNYTLGRTLTILFFAAVAIFLLLSTVCDFVVRTRSYDKFPVLKYVAEYSIYTNAMKLLSMKINSETMPAIHGFRFLSTCLVLIGHRTLISMIRPSVNLSDMVEFKQSVLASVSFTLPRMVDTFFMLSGFLSTLSLLKTLRSGKKLNLIRFYLHRYLRLTPCVAALLLINIYILPSLGSGPIWETVFGLTKDFCRKNWWTNLLYVQNYVNRQEMCMPHTWYLAVDMHFYLLCPVIVYPLYHRPKVGLMLLGLCSITSLIIPAVQLAINQWPALFDIANNNFESVCNQVTDSYMMTYNRALPYLIGILLGYDVASNKRHVTTAQVVFCWILTGFILLLCGWANYFSQPLGVEYNVVWEMVHVSVLRLGWSLAMAWIMYACIQGYGGPLTRFFSLPIFVPLSRMSYGIYLTHVFIQLWAKAAAHTPQFFSPVNELHLIWGDLAMSIATAFLLHVCFESPVIVLEKFFRVKRPSKIMKRVFAEMEENVATVIRNNSDSITDQMHRDSDNETAVLDSRGTSLDALRSSGAKPTRTIAEWAKIWKHWKSEVSKNGNRRDIPGKIIQNGSTRFQIEESALEEEFFIFLTAVSCGSDKNVSFEELEILKSARSELGSCSLRDDDYDQLSTFNSTLFTKKTR